MKRFLNPAIAVVVLLALIFSFAGCADNSATGLWENAVYQNDTQLGEGSKTITVKVEAEEKTVTFTVKTDKETVGEALTENSLVEGDMGEYGLYIKKVNGILADYSVDMSYWSFYINGEMASTGVDGAKIDETAVYSLVYTK